MDVNEQAVAKIFRVFLTEHWARFYYALEQDGVVFLDVPEDVLAQVEAEDADLAEFLRGLNGQPLDAASSRKSIGEHVFATLEGGVFPPGTVAKAFDSPAFTLSMRLFSVWLSGHETLLDTEPLPRAEWERLFSAWRQDPAVLRFAESLVAAGNPATPGGNTVH
jgi:hypothetical protein